MQKIVQENPVPKRKDDRRSSSKNTVYPSTRANQTPEQDEKRVPHLLFTIKGQSAINSVSANIKTNDLAKDLDDQGLKALSGHRMLSRIDNRPLPPMLIKVKGKAQKTVIPNNKMSPPSSGQNGAPKADTSVKTRMRAIYLLSKTCDCVWTGQPASLDNKVIEPKKDRFGIFHQIPSGRSGLSRAPPTGF